MPRRNYLHARDGQVYAVEWPEWFVHCAACSKRLFIVAQGEALTAREAEQRLRQQETEEDSAGWHRRKNDGLWYCPDHY